MPAIWVTASMPCTGTAVSRLPGPPSPTWPESSQPHARTWVCATDNDNAVTPVRPRASVTAAASGKTPGSVVVPEMTPAVDAVSPAGSPATDQVYGPTPSVAASAVV